MCLFTLPRFLESFKVPRKTFWSDLKNSLPFLAVRSETESKISRSPYDGNQAATRYVGSNGSPTTTIRFENHEVSPSDIESVSTSTKNSDDGIPEDDHNGTEETPTGLQIKCTVHIATTYEATTSTSTMITPRY